MKPRSKRVALAALLLVVLISTGAVSEAQQTSVAWGQWRGPNRDGVGDAAALPAQLPAELTEVWRVPVGEGHSGPLVVDGTVYQFSREDGREILRALSFVDGSEIWRTAYAAPFDVESAAREHGPGPKSTPVYANGRVFTLGISGVLSAVDAADGAVRWRHDFAQVFPQAWPIWGASMSPIVIGDRLFAHVGGDDGGAMMAFDTVAGVTIWSNDEFTPGYASPIHLRLADTDVLVTLSNEDIIAVDAADGATLWSMRYATSAWQNAVTPAVADGRVILSGLDMDIFSVALAPGADGWVANESWRNNLQPLYMSSPVMVGNRLFGMTHKRRGQFVCYDVATGEPVWTSRGREGENAALVALGDRVALLTDEARLVIIDAGADAYAPLAEYEVATTPTWAHPVFTPQGMLIKDLDTLTLWSFGG
jgi:outer membrane protein assembly factor BamB